MRMKFCVLLISVCPFAINSRSNRNFHVIMITLMYLTALTGFMLADWALCVQSSVTTSYEQKSLLKQIKISKLLKRELADFLNFINLLFICPTFADN